jgi:hypothetical protein
MIKRINNGVKEAKTEVVAGTVQATMKKVSRSTIAGTISVASFKRNRKLKRKTKLNSLQVIPVLLLSF